MAKDDLEARGLAGDVGAQLELSGRLDDQGRHTEAIDWLARAARTGDPSALGRLGVRLVTGRDSPLLPQQGQDLLQDAADRGAAEAASFLAVLAGGGFHRRQDWQTALDQMQRAAELGDASARTQLGLLADGRASGAGKAAEVWRRLRERVDVGAWTSAPDAETLSHSPLVRSVRGLVPRPVCDWIIGRSAGRLIRAEVHDPETGRSVMGETRTNRVANFPLEETTLLNLLVQARISAAVGIPAAMMEAFAVLHYAVGEEASEHYDFLDPAVPSYAGQIARMGQRVATCLLYLNDGYEGGETEFTSLGLRHRGGTGDALIFFNADADAVPDPRTAHAGRPPTSGEKWVLSQFIRNRPVAPGAVGRPPAR